MKACIVMLTLNEEKNIGFMIDEVRKLYSYDLFIVDGKSKDKTVEIAKSYGVKVYQQDEPGYGGGIRKAIEIAYKKSYDILTILDCDRTYQPIYIKNLLKKFPKYDFVTGYRAMKNIEFGHRYPNIFFTALTNLLYNTNFKDVNSGMWAMKPKKFYGLIKQNGFDITAEIAITAAKNKYKIAQIPIHYLTRVGSSKIRIRDGFIILWEIIRKKFS